jgi:hypothetical protein
MAKRKGIFTRMKKGGRGTCDGMSSEGKRKKGMRNAGIKGQANVLE